jgi:hypothetical protein
MSDLKAISYEDAISLTPSDTTTFAKPYAGFMVTVAGNVTITTLRGRKTLIPALIIGAIYSLPFTQLWNTGTTATGIVAVMGAPYIGPG